MKKFLFIWNHILELKILGKHTGLKDVLLEIKLVGGKCY